jgi:hypothetical protein
LGNFQINRKEETAIAKTDRCVVRNQAYRRGEFNIRERHNERKNVSYGNGDILPKPGMFTTANTYKSRIVDPFIRSLKKAIGSIVAQYLRLKATVNDLNSRLIRAQDANNRLHDRIDTIGQENKQLIETVKDYRRLRGVLGEEQTDNILAAVKAEEQARKRPVRSKSYDAR